MNDTCTTPICQLISTPLNRTRVNGQGVCAYVFGSGAYEREPHPSLNVPSTERVCVIYMWYGKVKKGCKAPLKLLSRLPAH